MNDLKLTDISTNNTLSGKYKLFVVDSNNEVVRDYPWQKNLILNQGMDAVPYYTYENLMRYAAGGNGTRSNSIYSADSSASVAGNTVTLVPGVISGSIQAFTGSYGGYGSGLQVGDVIQFQDFSQVQVLAVSGISASVTPGGTIPLQPFTIWKTSQVGLQSEYQRTNNYFAGAGYCQTTTLNTTSSVITQLRRTWDFNYETSPYTYTEVGVGWGSSENNTILSRVILPTPVYIGSSQKLRLIYELDVAVSPTASYPGTPFTASIAGWGTGSIVYGYQSVDAIIMAYVDGNGNQGGYSISEPAATSGPNLFVSNSSSSVVGGDKGGGFADQVGMATDAYVPGSYTLYRNGTFQVAQMARNDLRTIGFGLNYYGSSWADGHCAYFAVLTENQTKTNVQTLSLSWMWTWGRVLS
jgi:hypothetical protein